MECGKNLYKEDIYLFWLNTDRGYLKLDRNSNFIQSHETPNFIIV
jgi:hypothetical protein